VIAVVFIAFFIVIGVLLCWQIYKIQTERYMESERITQEDLARAHKQAEIDRIWAERGKVIRPRMCSELDEHEPLT